MAAGDKAFWSDIANAINPPLCKLVQQIAGQQTALVTVTDVVLTFGAGSEEIDTHNIHDTVTNNSRVTPNVAGYYRCHVRPILAFNTTVSAIQSWVRKNGAAAERSGNAKPSATTGVNLAGQPFTTILPFNGTTDYVEAGLQFTASANQATNNVAGSLSTFIVEYIRPL